MAELQDNAIEWLTGQKMCTVSFSQKKFLNRMKKIKNDRPDEVEIIAENEDGSICARIPMSWVKITPPRNGRAFTEEERKLAAERLRIAREKKKDGK